MEPSFRKLPKGSLVLTASKDSRMQRVGIQTKYTVSSKSIGIVKCFVVLALYASTLDLK
jgi:hypothetical protein